MGQHRGQPKTRISKLGAVIIIAAMACCVIAAGFAVRTVVSFAGDNRPAVGTTVTAPNLAFTGIPRVMASPEGPLAGAYRVTGHPVRPVQASPGVYKVATGQCLWGIATKKLGSGTKWTVLASLNHISSPWVIQPGQVITL